MNPRMLRIGALGTMLVSGGASAVGFGDIVLLSQIGEPLRAEVPILASAGEPIDAACFSLASIRGSELPVISRARFRLSRDGANARLSITGIEPVSEPVFVIGLRAHCGVDLQRDYVLMPAPPLMLAEAGAPTVSSPPTASSPPRKPRNFREWAARQGETLESIAESQSAGNLADQQRLLSALKRANPDIVEYEVLSAGRIVRIPNLSRRPAEHQPAAPSTVTASRSAVSEPPPAPAPRPRKNRPAPAAVATPETVGADRVVLGAAPEDVPPVPKPSPAPASASEVEERMLKLETTLSSLNREVDKLNSALALATEALTVQQQLMTAQSLQNPPAAVTTSVQPVAPPSGTSRNNWLELLLSALVGGGIAASMAHFLSRRPARREVDTLAAPTATPPVTTHVAAPTGGSAQITPSPPEKPSQPNRETLPLTIDIPLDAAPDADGRDDETVRVDYNDGNSALELAEIMISFGRIRGAAETLAMHIEENAPDNIQPWSMLLDLYRRSDMRSEFETLASQMRNKFNVRVPAWDDLRSPVAGLKSLEDYAHVVWRITNCWGEQECMDYLYELVLDNRAGNRSGFPLEVVEEIALLMRTLEEGYGLRRRG